MLLMTQMQFQPIGEVIFLLLVVRHAGTVSRTVATIVTAAVISGAKKCSGHPLWKSKNCPRRTQPTNNTVLAFLCG